MIESVLAEIKEAEKKAETIAAEADKQSETIIREAEEESEKILESARKAAKEKRVSALAAAEKTAADAYDAYIKSERAKAAKLFDALSDKAAKTGKKVFGVIANGDC